MVALVAKCFCFDYNNYYRVLIFHIHLMVFAIKLHLNKRLHPLPSNPGYAALTRDSALLTLGACTNGISMASFVFLIVHLCKKKEIWLITTACTSLPRVCDYPGFFARLTRYSALLEIRVKDVEGSELSYYLSPSFLTSGHVMVLYFLVNVLVVSCPI